MIKQDNSNNLLTSLLFSTVIICLLIASMPGYHYAIWWTGLSLLLVFLFIQKETKIELSLIGILLIAFSLFLLINTLFVSPIYVARGIYLPISLLIAFITASLCPNFLLKNGFKL